MGESRGGEGRPAGLPVIRSVQQLVQQFNGDQRELGKITIVRITDGVYAVDIHEHGAEEWETFHIST